MRPLHGVACQSPRRLRPRPVATSYVRGGGGLQLRSRQVFVLEVERFVLRATMRK